MKVSIITNIGRGSDPEPTIARYIRARWEKNKVTLAGTASCQGKSWNIKRTYYFPTLLKKTKEEILKNLFEEVKK